MENASSCSKGGWHSVWKPQLGAWCHPNGQELYFLLSMLHGMLYAAVFVYDMDIKTGFGRVYAPGSGQYLTVTIHQGMYAGGQEGSVVRLLWCDSAGIRRCR